MLLDPKNIFKKSRLPVLGGLLFLFFFQSGFSLTSSKSEGKSFLLPGNMDEIWEATIETLQAENIPIQTQDRKNGYIQTYSFPLYKNEYKEWAKAPTISSSGFCALEIGVVEKDPSMTILGIKAYYKRKSGLSTRVVGKRDKSRGVFEALLAGRVHDRLVARKYPKMKSMILGCDLHYDDETAHYVITGADPEGLAYEQGLRNGDVLKKIDDQDVTPGTLFGFFLNAGPEALKKFTVLREGETVDLPVTIFYLDPSMPHLGFQAKREPEDMKFRVTEVREGSPAAQAGLLRGDILLKQNGYLLDNWKNYYRAILAQKPGEPQVFQIERRGDVLEKRITPEGSVVPGSGPSASAPVVSAEEVS